MRPHLVLFACLVLLVPAAAADVWYVDKDNTGGTENGLSWLAAYTTIQAAVNAAAIYDEVWVVEGVYNGQRANDRGSLVMREWVDIYGGFAGVEEDRDERDWDIHVTIIDGSTARGGEPAYHVVVGEDDATLDGFTITGGNAAGAEDVPTDDRVDGGGMHNGMVSPTIVNCTFTGNSASYNGGAMFNVNCAPTVINCIFTENSCNHGGGAVHNRSSSPTFTNCTFTANSARSGGGIYTDGDSSPTVTDCTFANNSASYQGGGMLNDGNSSPTVTDCTFTHNSAGNHGGGMLNGGNSSPTVTNCTFTNNSAWGHGGGMLNSEGSSPTIENCLFENNYLVSPHENATGGGMYNFESSPTIVDCTFRGNSAARGAGMYNSASSPTIINCVFENNLAEGQIESTGSGVHNRNGSCPTLTNCTFAGNSASHSGAAIVNVERAAAYIVNCILWSNSPDEIYNSPSSSAVVVASDVQGGYEGDGNIDLDPLFIGAARGDYHLREGSPCIDAGTAVDDPTTDIRGVARPAGDAYDMGAYEFLDADEDGIDDVMEVAYGLDPIDPADADLDVDGDRLTARDEINVYDTDPFDADTDGDGIEDSVEIDNGLDPTNPEDPDWDIDSDELSARDEINVYGTDPRDADTDDDGLNDGWEVTYGFDPNVDDVDGDVDEDGLPNIGEYQAGANPLVPDTDGDAIRDGDEIDNGLDPANPQDADSDIDDDELSARDEINVYGTDPRDADTDDDGLPDGWEVTYGFDPNVDDVDGDVDGDGLPNVYEYQIETNPIDETDPPEDLYVATDGDDDEGLGTLLSPWLTIAQAVEIARVYTGSDLYGTGNHPETIHLAEGIYEERVVLVPDVTIAGAGASTTRIQYFDASDDSHTVVTAAQHTRIQDCTITLPGMHADVSLLLEIEDVVIEVADCILDGGDNPNSIGILISGANSSDSVIRDCTIRRLEDGIHAVDTGVNIANNLFEGIHYTAVFVRLPEIQSKAAPEVPLLGNAAAAGTGFNRFRSVMGNFIANMNPVEVLAESNDWGVYAAPEITAKIYGQVDFRPYIGMPLRERCDVNETGEVDAQDVQLVINEALGLNTELDCDLDDNDSVDAIDVQLVINAVLGLL